MYSNNFSNQQELFSIYSYNSHCRSQQKTIIVILSKGITKTLNVKILSYIIACGNCVSPFLCNHWRNCSDANGFKDFSWTFCTEDGDLRLILVVKCERVLSDSVRNSTWNHFALTPIYDYVSTKVTEYITWKDSICVVELWILFFISWLKP